MKPEIKATIYDIFGYLLPGYLCLAFLYIAYNQSVCSNHVFVTMNKHIAELNINNILLITICAYPLGHILSSLSSFLIECVISKIFHINKIFDEKDILHESQYALYEKKFVETFHFKPEGRAFSLVACFVESRQPSVYSTAFVFLSFYGMALNLSLVFFVFSIWEIINAIVLRSSTLLLFFVVSITITVILFYHYLRFFRYYKRHILNGFLLPE